MTKGFVAGPVKGSHQFDTEDFVLSIFALSFINGCLFPFFIFVASRGSGITWFYSWMDINTFSILWISWPVISLIGVVVGFVVLLMPHTKRAVLGLILEILQGLIFVFFWMITGAAFI